MGNLDKSQLKTIQDGQTWEEVSKEQKANFDKVADAVNNKVDKDGSKVLSEKNFTTAYENKLKGIADNANNYTHPTGAGNNHIPAGGESGQVLVWSAAGTAVWGAVPAAASAMSYNPVKAPAKAMGSMVTAEEYNSLIDKLIAVGIFIA